MHDGGDRLAIFFNFHNHDSWLLVWPFCSVLIPNEAGSVQVVGKTIIRRSLALPCLRSIRWRWDSLACRAAPVVYVALLGIIYIQIIH